ncbi:MAG: EAL domain-containing protein [Gemmatimonadota bacterium]
MGSSDLHLWFPTPHVAAKARAVFAQSDSTPSPSVGGGFCYALPVSVRETVIDGLERGLSAVEREDTRVLAVDSGVEPTAHDLARVEPLGRLVGRVRNDWLLGMLHERRLTSHFQPIALARDPGLTYGHEALLRGVLPDGSLVPPTRLFDAAREAGLMFQLDLAARRSAIAAAHSQGLRGALFVNFAPTAIYDPTACLRTTVAAIDAAGMSRDQVVFEIVETERAHDTDHLRRILDYYRNAGFRIALDDVGSGYSSLNLIHLLRPDILKLDMELVRGVDQDPYKARIAANLLDVANALGIETLAEGIETEGELEWTRAHGATYVQGFLLGRPAPAPTHYNGANYAIAQASAQAIDHAGSNDGACTTTALSSSSSGASSL